MFKFLILFAVLGVAQDSRVLSSVTGRVIADESLAGRPLIVKLVDPAYHKDLSRAYVALDGSFEFRDVVARVYTVELESSTGDFIDRQRVNLRSSGDQVEFRLAPRANKLAGSGTVSVRELQHPLSAKLKKIFDSAQKASAAGDYLKAIGILRGALNDPSAGAYARMNMGVAYLRAGHAADAVPELREAVRLLPEDAMARTNLAYALLRTERLEEGEAECRRALELDRNNAKARWMMGAILLNKGSHDDEAVEDLRLASRELPQAALVLARFYERNGQKDAAARELRVFLPQASGEEKSSVERWLSKLTAK